MAASLWPWLAVAAAGALHGLNPLTGWAFAAWRRAPGPHARPLHLVWSIAAGQVGAVLAVACAVPFALRWGLAVEPWVLQAFAAALLILLVLHHFPRAKSGHAAPRRSLALGLWSFVVGIGHGAGWMLVPALASFCGSEMPAPEIKASGSLLLGLLAVGVHLAAMLATTAAMAACVRCLSRGNNLSNT